MEVLFFLVIGVFILLWIFGSAGKRAQKQKEQALDAAKSIIREHIDALRIKQLQKLRRDDYGNLLNKAWLKEVDYFYDNVLLRDLPQVHTDKLSKKEIYPIVDAEIEAYTKKKPISDQDVTSLSPTAFESYCAQLLTENGWQATTTKASGDQGIDVIATKDGIKAVFQCKKHSSPVGNKAVQEAIAGKAYALQIVLSLFQMLRSRQRLSSWLTSQECI